MAGLIRRIFVWQLAPLRSRAQDPQHPVEHLPSVLPRTSTAIGTALGLQQRLQLRPLPLSHLPASSHPRLEDPPALVLLCRYSCQTARRKKFQTIYETGPSRVCRVIADQCRNAGAGLFSLAECTKCLRSNSQFFPLRVTIILSRIGFSWIASCQ